MSHAQYTVASCREEHCFNSNWQFQLAEQPTDADWRNVMLPHDWSVEHPFSPDLEGCTGYLPGGVGWYQKHFEIVGLKSSQRAFLVFDGVYNHSEVRLNGTVVATQISGYAPFVVDITEQVKIDGNELLVRVDRTRIADSRWYTGSGIYRDVKLVVLSDVHVPVWGNFIHCKDISQQSATIVHELQLNNNRRSSVNVDVQFEVVEKATSRAVASLSQPLTLAAGAQQQGFDLQLSLPNPSLWSTEQANLYVGKTKLIADGQCIDQFETVFGIRDIHFCPETGFYLNGVAQKIKGVCLHHDAGLVGAAIPDAVWARRLNILKAGGMNAIRIAHNPASDRLLTLCDELGILVQDEFFDEWDFPKDKRKNMNEQHDDYVSRGYADYFQDNAEQDLRSSLLCHRNHPSIFMWSIGNEIEWTYPRNVDATGFFDVDWSGNYFWSLPPNSREEIVSKLKELPAHDYDIGETAQKLAKWTKQLDETRPVTANCILPSASYESGYADALDVIGFSYRQVVFDYGHQHHPHLPIIGNESLPQWHEWKAVMDRPHVSGVFLWTGIDYMGEVNEQWPTKALAAGLLDTAGFGRAPYYLYKTLWTEQPMVHIETQVLDEENYAADLSDFSAREKDADAWKTKVWIWPKLNRHWNYASNQTILIQGFTNCDEMELLLNGMSLGSRQLAAQDDRILKWAVPYEQGELKAIGRTGGKVVTEQVLKSTGIASDIRIQTCDSDANYQDQQVRHLIIDLVDGQGQPVCHQETTFSIATNDAAQLVGVDNGAPASVQPFQNNLIETADGRALVLIRLLALDKDATVTIQSDNGLSQTVTLS
ncbi:beta-galactosidase [Neiella marina]|uniref:Beta-galactosidase n=1 Tax=Neiella marina TaxID=508461 RepID=A0A8J2U866_9GAMM|nr:glycoside hydrolase family 2 TIM barrel-domain containing protein [Neiella marina]GGA85561.1 beta-galactosidase [Neiella marina]